MAKYAVLFDIDGTLLSTGGAGGRAMHAALKQGFDRVVGGEDVAYAGRCDKAIFAELLQVAKIEHNEQNIYTLTSIYLELLQHELNSHDAELLPGVRELLEHFDAREDVALGLLTGNLKRGADLKLKHFGIHDYFLFGGFGDNHACRNALASSMLSDIKTMAGVENPDNIWIIGDTPADVACAKAINANCVAVATGLYKYHELVSTGAEFVLNDLTESVTWHKDLN